MNYIKYFYIGAALTAFGNLYMTEWRFWAIVIPVAFLDSLIENKYKNGKKEL